MELPDFSVLIVLSSYIYFCDCWGFY